MSRNRWRSGDMTYDALQPRLPVVYISGPLQAATDLAEARSFYELLAEITADAGWSPYLPHQQTDPERNADVSSASVFERDQQRVIQAELVLAYVGAPSLGVGAELAIAREHRVPILAVHGPEGIASRFIAGMLAATQGAAVISYADIDDLQAQLAGMLSHLVEVREGCE